MKTSIIVILLVLINLIVVLVLIIRRKGVLRLRLLPITPVLKDHLWGRNAIIMALLVAGVGVTPAARGPRGVRHDQTQAAVHFKKLLIETHPAVNGLPSKMGAVSMEAMKGTD